jgi:hypothetical protein
MEHKEIEGYAVIDLDATCVNSWVFDEKTHKELWKKYSKYIDNRDDFYIFRLKDGDYVWGVKRPYLDEFLDYCFQHFTGVAFWSAGGKEYVLGVIEKILHGKKHKPVFIFDRTYCDEIVLRPSGRSDIWKPLKTAYVHYPKMNSRNTWLIDDNKEYARDDILNWIPVAPFEPDLEYLKLEKPDMSIDQLKSIIEFFRVINKPENVQTVVRRWEPILPEVKRKTTRTTKALKLTRKTSTK